MTWAYKPYIAQSFGELSDQIGGMMLSSPKFEDTSGYFPGKNIDSVFAGLSKSLDHLRLQLGEDRYARLGEMATQMRALFEADPEDETGESLKGREIILDMINLLKVRRTKVGKLAI